MSASIAERLAAKRQTKRASPDVETEANESRKTSPSLVTLRTSCTSFPPLGSPSATPSPPSSTSSTSSVAAVAAAIVAEDLLSPAHLVRVADYARDASLAPNVRDRGALVGVAPVFAMLDRWIGKTLASPTLSPCRTPAAAVICPAKSGGRSAVHTWCATNPQRVAVVTWCFLSTDEISSAFFSRLFAFAAARQPCVLLLHRITERLTAADAVHATFDAVWKSYYAFYEHREYTVPPVWLLFVDHHHPGTVLPTAWSFLETVVISGFSGDQIQAYVRSMIEQELSRRLESRDDVQAMLAEYASSIAQVEAAAFENPREIAEYVRLLFAVPNNRLTVEEMHVLAAAGAVDPRRVLPCAGSDFHLALTQLHQHKADMAQRWQRTS